MVEAYQPYDCFSLEMMSTGVIKAGKALSWLRFLGLREKASHIDVYFSPTLLCHSTITKRPPVSLGTARTRTHDLSSKPLGWWATSGSLERLSWKEVGGQWGLRSPCRTTHIHGHTRKDIWVSPFLGIIRLMFWGGFAAFQEKLAPAGIAKIKITYDTKYLESLCRKGEIISIPYAMRIHL